MPVRWSSQPQPVLTSADGQNLRLVPDTSQVAVTPQVDILPGASEPLDVVVRYDGEDECYGWNNESYFVSIRNPKWRLPKGRYAVEVRICSASEVCEKEFRLTNEGAQGPFLLAEE